jgi:hypothetical protein
MIVADICAALDLGALKRAADLLVVLRLFLSDHPDARKRIERNVVDWRSPAMQEPKCKIFSASRIETFRAFPDQSTP